jgi:ABC-type branched-subunit amino acid transport system substrate-binding protein
MIRRSTRTVVAGSAVLALAVTGLAVGTASAGGEEGGWAVDTENCPDPDAVNAPIEGEVLIGSVMPLSGEAAGVFEPAARGFQAYINYANAQGLLAGYTLTADIKDDQYNPANTPSAVNELIDSGAHLISGLIGTGNAEAVRDTLNEECIPMLNLLTGDPRWGNEVADYPWVTGILTSYSLESQGYAASIAAEFPDQQVGIYYVNNAFGNVYMDAFREAADEQGLEIVTEQTVEQGVNDLPTAQTQALADAGVGVIMATPLGIQCVTFLGALAEVKAANPDWQPAVYMTNTCASALILMAAGASAEGIYTSASMGLIDVGNPEVAAVEPAAGYVAEMNAQGLGDIITTGGAGWNAAEVTVQILIDAAASPDGLTQASIINAARNLNFHPTLLREGQNYVMNGEDDAFYSEVIQVVQYSAENGIFTDVGEPFDFESTPDAGDPVVAAPIVASGG